MPRRHRQVPAPPSASTGWQWRTFPVFFAFVCGVFIAGLAAGIGNTPFSILFLASLAGMGFGLAHILTRQIALRRVPRLRGPAAVESAEEEAEAGPPPPRRRGRRRR